MQVILKDDVPNLGNAGDVVTVKNGYGRNYLIPQNLALLATPKNIKQFDHQKRIVASRVDKLRKAAMTAGERLRGYACTITRNSGDGDRLFGSVSAKDIANALADDGIEIARRNILLDRPLKQLGIFPVEIHLHAEVRRTINVWVVAR